MKLLFILPEYLPQGGGGIITFYRHLLPEFVRQGHQVKVIIGSGLTHRASADQQSIDGVDVEFLETSRFEKYLQRFAHFAVMPGLRRYLAAAWACHEQAGGGEGYDLVETTDWGLLFVPWLLSEFRLPAVVQCHGSIGQIDLFDPIRGEELQGVLVRLLEATLLARADEVQTYSKANQSWWSEQSGRNVSYILPALPSVSTPVDFSKSSGKGLVVGRIQQWKGPQVLCEALRLCSSSTPVIEWMGRDTHYLEQGKMTSAWLSETYPDIWGKKIVPIGPRAPEIAAQAQAEAAFVIVPSTWDVFNFTCVEAMAAGKVVICSTGAGASDLIVHGENGFLFERGNALSLAKALDEVNSLTSQRLQAVARHASNTVLSKLDPAENALIRLNYYSRGRTRELLKGEARSLYEAVMPSSPARGSLALLDQLPLRKLIYYLTLRLLGKVCK